MLAAKCRYERIVKLLFVQDNTNSDATDIKYIRMPLKWATEGRYQGVVKLLLERNNVNSDISKLNSETTIEPAVSLEVIGVIESLTKPTPPLLSLQILMKFQTSSFLSCLIYSDSEVVKMYII